MLDKISIPDDIDFTREKGSDIFDRYSPFIQAIQLAGFQYHKRGSFRATYLRHNVVIKVPRNGDGIIDNITEAFAWRKYKSQPTNRHIYLAPSRLLANNCLLMSKVEIDYNMDCPPWASNLVDGQWGKYKGRAVSYDYAFEIKERLLVEKKLGVRSQFWNSSLCDRARHKVTKEEPIFNPNQENDNR